MANSVSGKTDLKNLTAEQRETCLYQLEAAGLYPRVLKLGFSCLPQDKIRDVLAYVHSAEYRDDLNSRIGICFTGNPAVRRDVLMIFAKGQALSGRGVKFVSVHTMQAQIENDAEKRTAILRAEYLYLDLFEKNYIEENCCPYTLAQRDDIESVIVSRMDAGHVTYFSTAYPWDQLKWWSAEFKSMLRNNVRDITIY